MRIAGIIALLLVCSVPVSPSTDLSPTDLYKTLILTELNNTLNYSKIPWILIGVNPVFARPTQLKYDTIEVPDTPTLLDPRTCPGEIAICYQLRQHEFKGDITYGKNYTATSKYILPDRRARFFYCVGDDTDCVAASTHCFCSTKKIPLQHRFIRAPSKCTDDVHLCRNSYSSFTLCSGNITSCREQYQECQCGRYSACAASRQNTCLNTRHEFVICPENLRTCLKKYPTCFCGTEIMQLGCASKSNLCMRGEKEHTCYGELGDCALRSDTCECT